MVSLFLSDASRQAAERISSRFPAVKDMVKDADALLRRHAGCPDRGGTGQVVILGAGLDTRAVRKPSPGVRYFEIDDPATIDLKRRCYADARINADVTLIPGNYVRDGLIDLLRSNGFALDVPTYLIWEGNVMYVPLATGTQTLLQLRRQVKRFRLSFDYLTESVIAKTTGDASLTILVESFEAMRAPWLSGIDDIHGLARELGVRVVENVTTGELYRKIPRPPGLVADLPALLDQHARTLAPPASRPRADGARRHQHGSRLTSRPWLRRLRSGSPAYYQAPQPRRSLLTLGAVCRHSSDPLPMPARAKPVISRSRRSTTARR
ncbi:MAG TPA: class I SAM-dependent methyltransferase [Vicinamibacterales bacterium]|nr:class I SAM-dependent methyltransferase [Vicinamibacterales bacterium]